MIRYLFGAAILAALTLCCAPVFAQDVTLTSRDGKVKLSGTLTSYDGEFYRIDSVYGPLVLDGQGVVCSGTGCPDMEAYVARFTLSGAPGLGDVLMPLLLEAFAARRGLAVQRSIISADDFTYRVFDPVAGRDLARIVFHVNSTDQGFADLLAAEADIAMATRALRPSEIALGRDAGLGDLTDPARLHVVALDALVPVVARGNPVRQMAVDQLAGILSGEIRNWDENGTPIILYARDSGSGLQQAVHDLLLAPSGLAFSTLSVIRESDADLVDAVAVDPAGLGVARFSEMGNTVPVQLLDNCGMVLSLTARTIKTEDYPFVIPMFLYSAPGRLPLFAREFMSFLASRQAHQIIRRAGYVDVGREEITTGDQGLRFVNAIGAAGAEISLVELQRVSDALKDASRLTTTFRFQGGLSDLDMQSAALVTTFARALERGELNDRDIIFAGFSDGAGNWQVNQRIAGERASAVLQAVRKAAPTADFSRIHMRAEAFGETMPLACDDTAWGRSVNRRVEIWLRE